MAWIKRNLFFAISGLVALLLIGAGGWYLFTKMNLNKATQASLEEAYSTLDQLSQKQVGDPKLAEQQIQQLREIGQKFRARFKSVPPIPYTTNVATITSAQFATTLQVTIDQLQRAATVASVDIPQQFTFSFGAQKSLTKFAPGSLGPLAVQLGEVKTICDVLYAARVNALLSLRREKISTDDEAAGGVDSYLEKKSITTEMATVTPYEISFRCFGTELSAVLQAFASSDYCFIVESVNVQNAKDSPNAGGDTQRPVTATTPMPGRGGLPTFLDEEQLQVTMALDLVKLNANAKH